MILRGTFLVCIATTLFIVTASTPSAQNGMMGVSIGWAIALLLLDGTEHIRDGVKRIGK